MRRALATLVLSSLILTGIRVPSGWSEETSRKYTWKEKLKRGFVNILTSPAEVPISMHEMVEKKNLLTGWTVGVIAGLGNCVARMGAGVLDVATFLVNMPEDYKRPLMDPEYVWQRNGTEGK